MNATKIVSGGSAGGALAAAIVYVLGRFNIQLTAEDGALAAVALVAVAAFVAHNGIAGVFRIIWKGSNTPSQPVSSGPATPPAQL